MAPTTVIDCSNITRDFTHYVAIFFWIGWMTFYVHFFISIPFLWYYGKPVLTAIVGLIVLSAIYPIADKAQPKVFSYYEIFLS